MINVKKNPPSGTIILDQPKTRNALSREMLEQFSQALSDLHQEKSVRAVIVTGSGPIFCSGVDLKQWQLTTGSEDADDRWQSDASQLQSVLEEMLRFPKPLIAAVDGAAIGAGLSLVLACDLVVASQRATFSVPSARLGLVSGFAAPLLHFRLGSSTAARLLLGLDELDVDQARNLGLVHRVVAPDQIWVRAHQWAEQVAACPTESLQLSKRILNEMVGEQVTMLLSTGAAAMAASCTTENAQEGLNAFHEKRPPQWKK